MATITEKSRGWTVQDDQRLVLFDVSWEFYEAFGKEFEDRHVRLTYDDGTLEIMTTSSTHEIYKRAIARLVSALTEELNVPILSAGSTTFKKKSVQKGFEPDECWYIANEAVMRGKLDIDVETDLPPDLTLEIDLSVNSMSRFGIYAGIGVPEVWRFDGKTLKIYHLQENGGYVERPASLNLPYLEPGAITRFLERYPSTDETSWIREFREWVRAELMPRIAGAGDGA